MPTDGATQSDYRVLILPPTRRDGEVTCQVLERAGISCGVCTSPVDLADHIQSGVGAIIVTDALVGDSRLSLITSALNSQPSWSDTATILLSRTDRTSAAIAPLVASLTNVTILDRPTSTRTLVSSVQAAIRGRRRQYQLRDQLAALRDAQEALRNADRRKDEFLAMLGHELRNPLAPIRTASEVLARTLPTEGPTRSAVNVVRRQVSHLTRMVDDLLDVSRITQGRIELQRQCIEVSSVVAQALEGVESMLGEKRHKVHFKAYAEPLYVDGDSVRLVQSVTNLLTNAIKYTDDGGDLHVETYAIDSMAVVSIRDNGVGITADLMPRIFSLFVQSARSLDRAAGGLGIGLSVVERIIEMHGGSVTAFSAGAGHGSTFKISLPRIGPPEHKHLEQTPLTPTTRRILVVDDNVDAASSLAELLKLDGHVVEVVYSAKAALATVRMFQPDLVLLDIGLPDMNGYQVAQRIRDSGQTVRIVALSGYGQSEDIRQSSSAGIDAHLVKPVTIDLLERVIAGNHVDEGVTH